MASRTRGWVLHAAGPLLWDAGTWLQPVRAPEPYT